MDVYRVLIQENEPTKTIASTVGFDRNMNVLSGDPNTEVQPYDIITVRTVPDFQLQSIVTIGGEVLYPGQYALIAKNETIASLISRAGGLTKESFTPGTKLQRSTDEKGAVIIQLDEALRNPNSNNNIVLKSGDVITIPKTKDLVTIYTTGTKSKEAFVQVDSVINVPFYAGQNAKFYIEQYTGGLYSDKDAKWKDIYVSNPNGRISKSKNFFLFKTFPKVEKGSEIRVALKEKKKEEKYTKKKDPESFERSLQRTTLIATLSTIIIGLLTAIKGL